MLKIFQWLPSQSKNPTYGAMLSAPVAITSLNHLLPHSTLCFSHKSFLGVVLICWVYFCTEDLCTSCLLFWNSLIPNTTWLNPSPPSGLDSHKSLPGPLISNYKVPATSWSSSLLPLFLLALFIFQHTVSFKCLPLLPSVSPPPFHPKMWAPRG